MKKSQFLGITVLNPGEGLDSDNYAFTGRDRELIDYGIKLGAKLHRHNNLPGLSDPLPPASASVLPSGGFIPAGLTINVGYTYEDVQGGETRLSPTVAVTTGAPVEPSLANPTAVLNLASGGLTVGTYYYAVSFLDADGGETPVGGTVSVDRTPGGETAQIELSGLAALMPSGAVKYRLYRAVNGGVYDLLTEGSAETFVDDGGTAVNCDVHPQPDSVNTTRQTNLLQVPVPTPADEKVTAINIYASLGNDFAESSLLASYPVASAGEVVTFAELSFLDHAPPDVNTSFGGANKIDAETELVNMTWLPPVAASADLPASAASTHGDVVIVLDEDTAYEFNSANEWAPLIGGGGGGGSGVDPALKGEGVGRILFGADLTKPRGTHFATYIWIGEASGTKPEHMAEFDILVDTAP
jgi:hypothetical protein